VDGWLNALEARRYRTVPTFGDEERRGRLIR